MYSLSALVLLFLYTSPSLGIPPPDFGFPEAPNDTTLSVIYQNSGNPVAVSEGQLFGVNGEAHVAAGRPLLTLCSSLSGAYRRRQSFELRVHCQLQWLLCCHHG